MSQPKSNYYRNGENIRFVLINAEAEKELFLKARAGCKESREFLIHNHLLFAAKYGKKRVGNQLPEDEVVSAVNEALMRAVDSFDPNFGSRFTRYLVPFLRGAIAALWKSKNIVKIPIEKDPNFSSQSRFCTYGEDHSVVPVQGMPSHTAEPDEYAVTGSRFHGREDPLLTDDLAEEIAQSESASKLLAALSKYRSALKPDEQELLRLVYDEGLEFAEIARERNISRQAVQQAHNRILGKLRAAFEDERSRH